MNTSISKIPYVLEKRVLRNIIGFLENQKTPFETKDGKKIDINNKKILWKLESKVSQLNNIELELFFDEIEKKGYGWGTNYLIGGLRKENQLCLMGSKLTDPVNSDNFLSFNGKPLF